MWKQHHRIKKENKAKKKNGNGTDKKQKQIKRDKDSFGSDLQIPMNTHG